MSDFWPLLLTALLVVVLGIYSWRRREVPGARYFAGACLLWAVTLVGLAAEATADTLAAQVAWHTFQAILQLPIATAITCFVLDYVQPGRWLTRRTLALLCVPPLLTALLLITNPSHHLVWRDVVVAEQIRVLPAAGGWLLLAYAAGLTLVQAAALVWLFVRSPQHRAPAVLMLGTLAATRILFLLALTDINPTAPLDSTFVVTLVPVVTYAIALFGFNIFDPAPAARQAVLAQMSAGMVVCDVRGRVVSINPAAEQMLGVHAAAARGRSWQELLPAAPPLPAPGHGPQDAASEFTRGHDAGQQQFALTLSPLHDFRGLPVGQLLVLRDVTAQRRIQAQVVEQQRTLAALHEREQLARELHDSIGQVLGAASLQVETARQLLDDGQTDRAEAQLARLAAVLQDAHADVREQILNLRTAPSPQQPLFAAVHHYLDSFTDNYAIVTRLAVGAELRGETLAPATQMQLFRILQEALSNARRHGSAQRVEVTFAAENGTLRMCISDDGCGFVPGATPGGANHWGLGFMRERAAELGGSLHIDSAPGTGARVAVEIPWKEL